MALNDISEAVELFENSEPDMAMAQTVPLLTYWEDGLSPADLQSSLLRCRTGSCSVVASTR